MFTLKNPFSSPITFYLTAGTSLLIVAIFLYCGLFAIPSADDYAYANLIHKGKTFWDAQVDSYIGWSGRYTATLLITWFGSSFLDYYWLVPWISISSLLSAIYLCFWTVFYSQRHERFFHLFPISFFAVFLSSSHAGHGVGVINGGFFWLAGAVTYQIGAVFFYLAISTFIWMARGKYSIANFILTFLFLLLSIGSNETLMLLNLFSVFALSWFYRRQFQIKFIFIILAAIIGCAVVFFAPGNSVRSGTAEGGHLLSALGICAEKTVQLYAFSLLNPLLWLLVILYRENIDKMLSLITNHVSLRAFFLFMTGLVYTLYFPVAWALNSGAPNRLISFIAFFCTFASIFIIRKLLTLVSSKISLNKLVPILFIFTILLFTTTLEPLYIAIKTIPTGKQIHSAHIMRNSYVRQMAQKGAKTVKVKPIERNKLLLFNDLDSKVHTLAYSQYFGVRSVAVEQ